jgi:type VI secretion system secreted protein VgrG
LTDLVDASAARKLLARARPFTGTLTVKVYTVNSMCGGLSFNRGNLICVCTRAWWRAISESDQNQVMIHEMGHKIGMVPKGTTLDRTANQYTGKGHVGSHCHTGLAVLASYDNVPGSRCVMFGMTNGVMAFCAACAKAVKKMDLSAGWAKF